MYISKNDERVCRYLKEQNNAGKSLRVLARQYGELITHGDIQRAVNEGRTPIRNDKREAMGLPPLITVVSSAEYDNNIYLPPTTKVLTCKCGIRFYRTSNAMKKHSKECKG